MYQFEISGCNRTQCLCVCVSECGWIMLFDLCIFLPPCPLKQHSKSHGICIAQTQEAQRGQEGRRQEAILDRLKGHLWLGLVAVSVREEAGIAMDDCTRASTVHAPVSAVCLTGFDRKGWCNCAGSIVL